MPAASSASSDTVQVSMPSSGSLKVGVVVSVELSMGLLRYARAGMNKGANRKDEFCQVPTHISTITFYLTGPTCRPLQRRSAFPNIGLRNGHGL